ncbi:MAG: hypothetical protein R3247_06020 [Rhodothermales bacterium]|nr:hypothetical protein [Rhodothermales bacterium]
MKRICGIVMLFLMLALGGCDLLSSDDGDGSNEGGGEEQGLVEAAREA